MSKKTPTNEETPAPESAPESPGQEAGTATAPPEVLPPGPIDLPKLVESSTLLGELRDEILKRLRALPKPWTTMSEREQQDTIDSVEKVSAHLIHEATKLIAANGAATIQGLLEKVVFKDGIQATIKMSKFAGDRHGIADAVGGPVLIVVCDAEQFMGGRGEGKPDPDQPQLPGTTTESSNVAPFKAKD